MVLVMTVMPIYRPSNSAGSIKIVINVANVPVVRLLEHFQHITAIMYMSSHESM